MEELKYILSILIVLILSSILISMIYCIRAYVPSGPYTWMSNLSSLVLFLISSCCIFFAIPHSYLEVLWEKKSLSINTVMRQELSHEFSMMTSKYIMYPLLVLEMFVIASLNGYLIMTWYQTGQWKTIVNKFIIMQRIVIICVPLSIVCDYTARLFVPQVVSSLPQDTYTLCWIFLYQGLIYLCVSSSTAAAIVRLGCVKYSLQFHNRQGFALHFHQYDSPFIIL